MVSGYKFFNTLFLFLNINSIAFSPFHQLFSSDIQIKCAFISHINFFFFFFNLPLFDYLHFSVTFFFLIFIHFSFKPSFSSFFQFNTFVFPFFIFSFSSVCYFFLNFFCEFFLICFICFTAFSLIFDFNYHNFQTILIQHLFSVFLLLVLLPLCLSFISFIFFVFSFNFQDFHFSLSFSSCFCPCFFYSFFYFYYYYFFFPSSFF